MPNERAITRRIWAPGQDDGYDPQGAAYIAGSLLVSAYQSTALSHSKGPCRVFRVDASTGRQTGSFDVPAPCGHAGGLAVTSDGTIYVVDTHDVFILRLDGAFGPGAPAVRQLPLGPGLTGGLAAADGTALWIGTYVTDGPGRLYRFDAADLMGTAAPLTIDMATRSVEIPSYAQGAAFDPDGTHVWISRSGIDWATLDELDLATGRLVARYPAPPGLEGLDLDAHGVLWTISEAGARRFFSNPFVRLFYPFNPLILVIHPSSLRSE
jgi:sugar lactone lactonase YvrE